ncbi:MAG: RepB family DNA primase [gamma proteobacterium symbiont of Lucinoma myriamae]|nr:RepB family DNA primase [gamma proteobacterium symbiont of Lucinoma myriamae]MCU7819757.1 RepB family DNA primase [gamma proteobacterium symbiont of Lucinoma myriamae]
MDNNNQQKDRTVEAVRSQVRAFQCKTFELGIRDQKTGKTIIKRDWTIKEIENSIKFFKYQNYQSHHIYIRPSGSQGIILMDDLTISTLLEMEEQRVLPALVVETSPMNYQAWIRVSHEPILPELATATAKKLADRFNADPNSADWRHFGRLAGFTNQKPEHIQSNGRFPYVLLREAKGIITPNAQELLEEGEKLLIAIKADQIKEREKLKQLIAEGKKNKPNQNPSDFFSQELNKIKTYYKGTLDFSKIDWVIAKKMAHAGFNGDEIKQAIAEASPDLYERKKGHIENYINRTVNKVFFIENKEE